MKNKNMLVFFDTEDSSKRIIDSSLGKYIDIQYIEYVSEDKRLDIIAKTDILLCWNPAVEFREEEFQYLKNAGLLQLVSAGANHLPFNKLPDNLLMASNVGAYSEPMGEHVLAMSLCLAKRLVTENNKLKDGTFDQFSVNKMFKNSICGIIGLGGIGKKTAKLFRTFGTKIFAINRSGRTDEEVDFIGTLEDLDCLLSHSDIVVLSLPLNSKTKGLIGQRELDLMKSNAMIIDVARGDIIHQEALYLHLKNNPAFQAGIDAWWVEPFIDGEFILDYPFFELPNFLGSPHNSAIVPGIMEMGVESAVNNVLSFINGNKIRGEVIREEYR